MPTDFIPTSTVKAATRTFTAPIVSADTYDAVITALTGDTNPLGASAYQTSGETRPGVEVATQNYRAVIQLIEPDEGKTIGSITVTAPTRAVINAAAARIVADADLAALYGEGTDAVQNPTKDAWGVRIKVHDPTGELYYLNFSRKNLRISSYESDALLAKVETWADSVAALN